jgi:hypothetical protein
MKDEDRVESCDPLPERELEPRLDGPDVNTRFTPPIHFFILHSTCNNNTQQVPSTLGVSISVSRTGGRKQGAVKRDCKRCGLQENFLDSTPNTKSLTLT